jgi:hypothetical protein
MAAAANGSDRREVRDDLFSVDRRLKRRVELRGSGMTLDPQDPGDAAFLSQS